MGAQGIEIHTGEYCDAENHADRDTEYGRIAIAAAHGRERGVFVAAGHGLDYTNTEAICFIKAIEELKQDLPAEGYTRLLEIFANLRRNTEDALMKAYAGEDLLTREGIQRQADQMRAELAGPGASPLDCVLLDTGQSRRQHLCEQPEKLLHTETDGTLPEGSRSSYKAISKRLQDTCPGA